MILTCPSCGTQYVVKDGAIPPEGRQVRCASCKHSWHQDPERSDGVLRPRPAQRPSRGRCRTDRTSRARTDESVAEAALIEPRSGPEAEERAYRGSGRCEDRAERTSRGRRRAARLPTYRRIVEPAEDAAPRSQADWNEPPEAEAAGR